jgi:hypothetical protein
VERAIAVAHEATFLDRAPTIASSVTGRDGGGGTRAPILVGAGR